MIKPILKLLKNGQLFLLLQLTRLMTPFYKISFIAALVNTSMFKTLAQGGVSLDSLMQEHGINPEHRGRMAAWLQMGVRINEIKIDKDQYQLNGISAKLAKADNDSLLAIVQETATLHHKLILHTPQMLVEDKLWTLDDQEGKLIARSSRISEPFQQEMITSVFPKAGSARLLEIGCGSGIYIRHAASHNPELLALGVELQPKVAEMAQQNITAWGLDSRVEIKVGDIRSMDFPGEFDIVTLYNNIYYFPVNERVALLKHIRTFLKPGGFFVLVTGAQKGQPLMEILNLWGATTQGCDRLPSKNEMIAQMIEAGFGNVFAKNLLPGDAFYMFVGYR